MQKKKKKSNKFYFLNKNIRIPAAIFFLIQNKNVYYYNVLLSVSVSKKIAYENYEYQYDLFYYNNY